MAEFELAKGFVTIGAKTAPLSAGLLKARTALDGLAAKMRGIAASVGGQMLQLGVQFGAAFAGVGAARQAVSFEQAMADVAAVTELTQEEFRAMEAAARDMGRTTQFTAVQAANALEIMKRQGLTTTQAIEALKPALDLAAAAGIEIADAAKIAGGTMKGFGLSTKDLVEINDQLAAAAARTDTSVEQLGDALPKVANSAKQLGVSMGVTTAILAKMQDAQIDASTAGTALRNVLLQLADPKVQKKLSELGVDASKFGNDTKSFVDILAQMEAAGIGVEQMAVLFGRRGGPQLSAAMGIMSASGKTGVEGLMELANALEASGGEAERMAKTRLNTTQGALTILASAASDAAISFGQAFLPILRTVAEFMTVVANKIGGLSDTTKRWTAGTVAAAAAVAVGATALAVMATVGGKVIAMVQGLTVALRVLSATPIGILITAIGALIAVIVQAVGEGDTWGQKFGSVFKSVAEGFAGFIDGVKRGLAALAEFYAPVAQALADAFSPVVEFLRGLFGGLLDFIKVVFTGIGKVFRNFGDVMEIIVLKVGAFVSNSIAWFANLWTNVKEIFSFIGRNWRELLLDMIEAAKVGFKNIIHNAKEFGVGLWRAIKASFTDDTFEGFEFRALGEGFKSALKEELKLSKPDFIDVSEEIARITDRIAAREAQRAQKGKGGLAGRAAGAIETVIAGKEDSMSQGAGAGADEAKKKQAADRAGGIIALQEFTKRLSGVGFKSKDLAVAEDQLAAQKNMEQHLAEIRQRIGGVGGLQP